MRGEEAVGRRVGGWLVLLFSLFLFPGLVVCDRGGSSAHSDDSEQCPGLAVIHVLSAAGNHHRRHNNKANLFLLPNSASGCPLQSS